MLINTGGSSSIFDFTEEEKYSFLVILFLMSKILININLNALFLVIMKDVFNQIFMFDSKSIKYLAILNDSIAREILISELFEGENPKAYICYRLTPKFQTNLAEEKNSVEIKKKKEKMAKRIVN